MMKRAAFTITELLVALAVVGTLAGVGFPVARNVIAKSRQAACLGQLRSLGTALEGYLQDHQQRLPDLETGRTTRLEEVPVIETVLLPYAGSPEAFRCPQDHTRFAQSGSSYLWNHLQSGKPIAQIDFFGRTDRPDIVPLITDKEAWHPGGVNFLYADRSSSNQVRFAAGQ